MGMLSERRIAFLTANEGVEQVELQTPWEKMKEEGADVQLLALEEGEVQAFNHLDKADSFTVDQTVRAASVDDYDALVLPGGVANPDNLRTDQDAVQFISQFAQSGKPIAAICHAPWVLIEADQVKGRRLTSWPSLQSDIRNAGGEWVDEQVVKDGPLITSRKPDDLEAFCREAIDAFSSN